MQIDELAELYKAFAEPVRLRILALLMEQQPLKVGQLVAALGLPQSTVSRHLGILRSAKLVRAERDGTNVEYRITPSGSGQRIELLKVLEDSAATARITKSDKRRLMQNRRKSRS